LHCYGVGVAEVTPQSAIDIREAAIPLWRWWHTGSGMALSNEPIFLDPRSPFAPIVWPTDCN
jgi:hypothetical protein